MSIQLKYNGFIINHINYEYKNSLENQQDEYYLEFMLDNVSVAVSKEEAIITLSGHAACLNEKDNDASKYRTLNLSVNYIYNIENLNNIDDQTETQEITIKLQLAGKYVEFFSDPNIIKTISKKVRKDSIVIFVSLNGETEELVYAAKELQKNDVASILFTTNGKSSLAKLATLTFIGYETETNYFPDYEVRSRLPLQIMTRIFCDAYSVRTGITQ